MGYFFNVICGNYDRVNDSHYYNGIKKNEDERFEEITLMLSSVGINNVRKSNLDSISENPNENYFYILNGFESFNILTPDIGHDELPLETKLRNMYWNHDNLRIIFIGNPEIFNDVTKVITKINLPTERFYLLNEKELNNSFFTNLINIKKRETLNIVYDKWSQDFGVYFPNLYEEPNKRRYRIVIGFFRFYKMFSDIKNCTLDEVFDNPNENYYYFINGDNMSDHFSKSLLGNDFKTLPLPSKVKECFLECPNFNIVLLNEHEYETKNFISLIDTICKNENLDSKRIYIWNNNSKLNQYKEELNTDLNVYSLDFLVKFICDHMVQFGEPRFTPDKTGNFFMCHNRSPKPHRYGLLALMMKNNILSEVDWSLVYGWYRKKQLNFNPDYSFYSPIFTKEECDMLKLEIDTLNDIDIKKSNFENEKGWFDDTSNHAQVDWKNIYENRTFESSYVNIVTESCYDRPEIHITEKSMKPFYFYQLPIFLSSYNHVKMLKDRFGFDLFDDIINHDYDNEPDDKKRFIMVFNEILRLLKNKEQVIEFYKNNEDRFIKNRDKIIDIDNSKRDEIYFKSLIYKK
jgi:hypothetical protein